MIRFRDANSHRLPRKITTRTPFSPNRKRKRWKGCHFAQAAKRRRAQTTKPRQKPLAPPPRRTPHSAREVSQKRARGGGGAGNCDLQPPPLGRLFRRLGVNRHLILPTTSTTPARRGRRTSPTCGSCRRPLKNCEVEQKPMMENQRIERNNGAKKKSERAKTRVGRIHNSKREKLRFASTRARRNENAPHTCTGA